MTKIPTKPEEIFEEFIEDYKKVFGADLVSIILYGSAARGEYIPQQSDINFMVVLTEHALDTPSRAIALVTKWHQRRVSTPLFLAPASITSSLDTFPIEFLNLRSAYKVIHGVDVLGGLSFDKHMVRIQCEREAAGKLVQLRERFLTTEGKTDAIEDLIAASLPTLFSLFQAIRFLMDKGPVSSRESLIASVAREAGLDADLFAQLLSIRRKRTRLASPEAILLMERYIREVRKLALFVDRMRISGE